MCSAISSRDEIVIPREDQRGNSEPLQPGKQVVSGNLPGVVHEAVFGRPRHEDAGLALAHEGRPHRRHELLVVLGSIERVLEVDPIARRDGLRISRPVGRAFENRALPLHVGAELPPGNALRSTATSAADAGAGFIRIRRDTRSG